MLGTQTAIDTISSIRSVPAATAAQSFQRLLAFCRGRLGTVIYVAERDGERAGFLILLTDVPDEPTQLPQGFIAYVAVAVEHRRQGAGRALLHAAAAEAQRRHLPHLSLMVSSHNQGAIALYRDEAFHDERVLMTKDLRSSVA